jgi:o-succinylbenzoate---CoA ligase
MKGETKTFFLDGKAFSKPDLKLFCENKISSEKIEGWEKEVFSFILEWLSFSSAIKVQTSGSTGKPKEFFLEKKFMEASAIATLDFFKLKPGDSALLCLPVNFIAGKMMIARAFVGGLNLILTKPATVPKINNVQKIDFCAMVPSQVAGILEEKNGVEQLEGIQNLIVGGSFLPENLESKIRNLKTNIWQTYGMTETITHIALRKLNGKNAHSWYTPLNGVETSLDERGCLVINSERIGVSHLVTNDLAELKKDGKFKILGRIDNVIISGGIKLIPEEIEKKLSGWVENDFYLSSLPDEKLGNKLVLYIEDDGKLSKQVYQLWEKIEDKLSGFEIPKEIIFSRYFKRTTSKKIIR